MVPAADAAVPGVSLGAIPAMKWAGCFLGLLVLLGMAGLAVGGATDREGDGGVRRHGPTVREKAGNRLADILVALWPARLDDLAGRSAGLSSWAEADRRSVWLQALLGAGRQSAASAKPGRSAPTAAERAAAKRLQAAGQELDAAFSGPVGARIGEVERFDASGGGSAPAPEAEGEPPCFAAIREGLAWPAKGRLAAAFEAGRPARQGIALATAKGEPVRAAAGGQVVFTGLLRGLGRVVIVAHGLHCHTVYACLSDVAVSGGESVAREAVVGRAGICPPAGGPGVYFELRFREKALNPAEWFAASP